MVFLRFHDGVDPCEYLEFEVVYYDRPYWVHSSWHRRHGLLDRPKAWLVRFVGESSACVWVE